MVAAGAAYELVCVGVAACRLVLGFGIGPHPNRPVPVPCRRQADPPAPFSAASDRSVTSMLTDE